MTYSVSSEMSSLQSESTVVFGAKLAAIYDFQSGKVYSVNESGRRILEKILKGTENSFHSEELNFIKELKGLGLDAFAFETEEPKQVFTNKTEELQFLALEVTSNCNLRCIHCYGSFGGKLDDEKTLSIEQQFRILKDAANLGCIRVQFIGGEVLLSKRLLPLIDIAKDSGLEHIEVYTNGTLITQRIAEEFSKRNVIVRVSVYSDNAKTHDIITGVKGSFELTHKGLLFLKEKNIETFVGTTLMKQNQEDMKSLNAMLKSVGVKQHAFDIVRPVGRGVDTSLYPDKKFMDSRILSKPSFRTSRESYLRFKYGHSCWQGCIAVTSNGDVLPCVFARNLVIGNVKDKSFREIMMSKDLQSYWRLSKDYVNVCRDCEYRYCCFDCRIMVTESKDGLAKKTDYCTYDPHLGVWKNK